MKKFLVILLAAMLVMGMAFVIGCSDDDDEATKPVVKQEGDPDAEEFDAMGEVFGFTEMLNNQMFDFMFVTLDSITQQPGFPGVSKYGSSEFSTGIESDSVYLTYHESSKYWYLYAQIVDTEGVDTSQFIITWIMQDSLQFLHGATPVQWPDSELVTGIKNGISFTIGTSNNIFSINAGQLYSLIGDIPGWGDIEINGSSGFDVLLGGGDAPCEFDFTLGSSFANVNLNLEDVDNGGCPQSGTASYGGVVNMSCTGDTTFTFNDYWSVVQTFSGTSIHYVVENSTHYWEFDEQCNDGPIATPEKIYEAILDLR